MRSAVVIGAGPAGLAASRELIRHGVDHVVLERGDAAGHTWAKLYDGLVLSARQRSAGAGSTPCGC